MKKLIGLSGAHGTGKTTVLNELSKANIDNVFVDDSQISRRVLEEMGMSLEQATSTLESFVTYQEAVFINKFMNDVNLLKEDGSDSTQVIIVDRTPADIFAYSVLWATRFQNAETMEYLTTWLDAMQANCKQVMSLYDEVCYFPIGRIQFVDDGVRAKQETQEQCDSVIQQFLSDMTVHEMTQFTVDARVEEIKTIIEALKNDDNTGTTEEN